MSGCRQPAAGRVGPIRLTCVTAKGVGEEGQLQHQPVIVHTVLNVGPKFPNLVEEAPVQPLPTQMLPLLGFRVVTKVEPGGIKPGSFGE